MIARVIGKLWVWFMSCALGVVALTSFGILDVRSILVTNFFLFSVTVAILGLSFTYWSMLPDTVEFGEWKTGVRAEAFIFGLAGLFGKIALGLGAEFFGLGLNLIGYHANVEQSPQTLAGMKAMIVILP